MRVERSGCNACIMTMRGPSAIKNARLTFVGRCVNTSPMQDFLALGISLGLGLLIGLQRERTDSHLGGIRTFPLISLLGTVCAMLAKTFGWAVLVAGFVAVAGVGIVANYVKTRSDPAHEPGQTTEIAALLTF